MTGGAARPRSRPTPTTGRHREPGTPVSDAHERGAMPPRPAGSGPADAVGPPKGGGPPPAAPAHSPRAATASPAPKASPQPNHPPPPLAQPRAVLREARLGDSEGRPRRS